MIPNGNAWHYRAVTKLPSLLRKIISKNNEDFYCLHCLYSFRTENRLKSHEKLCRNKVF